MFEAIIEKDRLEAFLDPVAAVVDEAAVRLSSGGIAVSAVDPANVALVDVELDHDAFESYEADDGVIGVNIDRFEDVVAEAEAGALVQLELDEETRKLKIAFDRVDFTLALIDPDDVREEPEVPDLELPAEVGLEGRDLGRAVSLAGMVGDHLELGADADAEAFFAAADGDTDQVHIEHERDELRSLTAADVRSLFSLDYLKDMNKAVPKDAEITLRLGEEMPAKIAFQIAEAYGDCQFMLSPRVEAEG